MQLGLLNERSRSSAGAASHASRLNSHGLAHDGAAVGEDLQLGDGATARRSGGARGGGHGAEAGSRGLLHEGAHSLGLAKNGVHDGRGCFAMATGGGGGVVVDNQLFETKRNPLIFLLFRQGDQWRREC